MSAAAIGYAFVSGDAVRFRGLGGPRGEPTPRLETLKGPRNRPKWPFFRIGPKNEALRASLRPSKRVGRTLPPRKTACAPPAPPREGFGGVL